MDLMSVEEWLRENDDARLERLWQRADAIRRAMRGDGIFLRGLLEISNYCVRSCTYCGLRAPHREIRRYRMTEAEILERVLEAQALGLGTVVLQSGEDPGLTLPFLERLVRRIHEETSLVITLSLGERELHELSALRKAGAERYFLRFETSNRALFTHIHPSYPGKPGHRLELLKTLKELGFAVGTGMMVGIPGQTYADVASDIEFFTTLDPDMIGIGPYLRHPATPLAQETGLPEKEQVPSSALMTCKVLALTRILCPRTNLPSTTALSVLDPKDGQRDALRCGANVIMPALTPPDYREAYEIYPRNAPSRLSFREQIDALERGLEALGRPVQRGRGDAISCDNIVLDIDSSIEGVNHERLF